jgi:polar amino acid transport system substrate-binding protein
MKKIVALILVAVMCVLCLAGCGAKKQTLKVGITEYEPMNYKDAAGNWTGFDTEFALAVAEELGMEVEFIVIDWDNKILEVNSGAIDCV